MADPPFDKQLLVYHKKSESFSRFLPSINLLFLRFQEIKRTRERFECLYFKRLLMLHIIYLFIQHLSLIYTNVLQCQKGLYNRIRLRVCNDNKHILATALNCQVAVFSDSCTSYSREITSISTWQIAKAEKDLYITSTLKNKAFVVDLLTVLSLLESISSVLSSLAAVSSSLDPNP